MRKRRNKRKEKEGGDKSQANQSLDDFFRNFNPGVEYFIAYTRTTECNPDSIFILLHYLDNDVELKTVDSTLKGGEDDDILTEKMERELFQVVKDHDNEAVKSLMKESNRFCSGSKLVEKLDGWSEEEVRTAFGRIEPRPPIPTTILWPSEDNYCQQISISWQNDGSSASTTLGWHLSIYWHHWQTRESKSIISRREYLWINESCRRY